MTTLKEPEILKTGRFNKVYISAGRLGNMVTCGREVACLLH